jgi:hypothetical protein
MASRKIAGWLLLIAGILLIFWVIIYSYNIFTVKTEVPEIFEIAAKKEIASVPEEGGQGLESQIEGMIGGVIGEQLRGLLPVDFLPKLLNLSAWSIFAGISIFAGSQISGLGIKLIKD